MTVSSFNGVYHVIAIKISTGSSVAVPATLLCINRRLYLLASSAQTSVIPSKADKDHELIIDLVIGIGLPMVVMALCPSSNLSL
jgi:pheromone a factor receptor